ncbi:hypothetical protein WJX72_009761 [[Myrmecia] bisecta]|uniref:B30.2/SPRY domain-containing protein n=1 Tax=[Myrmecia] bisecta TaxID=41462 RepID=A0AAW1PV21_9CHLO
MEASTSDAGEALTVPAGELMKRPPPEPAENGAPPKRSKKGKKKLKPGIPQLTSADYVRVVPIPKKCELLVEGWRPVTLSKFDKAPQATLSVDQMAVTSSKGYRMARATHGAYQGTWYFEITVTHLGETGHCRLGWSTGKGELQAPVGYDQHSFGYRDLEGSKVHRALREEYGNPYKEGDVVGCLLHMPAGGQSFEKDKSDIVSWKGALYFVDKPEPEPTDLKGSLVAFSLNGVSQGVAYRDFKEGTYYPAASLYTLPDQKEGATVTFNFGPDFKHSPPEIEGCPAARPCCELAGSPDDVNAQQPAALPPPPADALVPSTTAAE